MKSRSVLTSFGISLIAGIMTLFIVLIAAMFGVDHIGSRTASGIGPHGVYGPHGHALLWTAVVAVPIGISAGIYFSIRCYRYFRPRKKTA